MADTCAACGESAGGSSARWCGRCGARLTAPAVRRAAPTGGGRDAALVGAGTTTLLLDDPEAPPEVAAAAPTWSPRARAAAVAGVLLVVVAALLARPEPAVEYAARGFTERGDAARSGVVSLAPLAEPTRVAWSVDVGAARGATAVRSAGDLVLEQTSGGILAARDATTGEVRWLRRDLPAGDRAVRVGDVVIVAGPAGLRGVSADDGTDRWELPGPTGTLLPLGDDVLVASPERITAVAAAEGQVRWQVDGVRDLDGTVQRLVVGGAGIGVWSTSPPGILPSSPRATHVAGLLDPATGAPRWQRELGRPFEELPIAVGARVVAVAEREGVTVRAPDGTVQRRFPGLFAGHLAATGELLAVARFAGGVVGLDLRTGTERWVRPDLSPDRMVAADGLVIAANGTVVDAATGITASTQQRLALDAVAGESTLLSLPAVAGDDLEVRDRRGDTVVRAPLVPDEASAPAVGAGRVFVPTREGVQAYRVGDGARDWEFGQLRTAGGPRGGQATARTPAVAGTTVLLTPGPGAGRGSGIVALEIGGGVRTWDRDGDTPAVRGPLTLAGDVAFVPVGSEVHGYDVVTGRRAFAAVAGSPRGPLVVGTNRVIGGPAAAVATLDGAPVRPEVVAILRRDRSENWRRPLAPCSGPVLAGERVAWGTPNGLTALDERTGELAWELATERPVCLAPVATGGSLIAVVDPGTLLAVPAGAGGAPTWTVELPAPAVASPIVAGEHVLVPLLDGTLVAHAVADGSRAWAYDLGGVADSSPTVLDGHVLVHLRDGRLIALTR